MPFIRPLSFILLCIIGFAVPAGAQAGKELRIITDSLFTIIEAKSRSPQFRVVAFDEESGIATLEDKERNRAMIPLFQLSAVRMSSENAIGYDEVKLYVDKAATVILRRSSGSVRKSSFFSFNFSAPDTANAVFNLLSALVDRNLNK